MKRANKQIGLIALLAVLLFKCDYKACGCGPGKLPFHFYYSSDNNTDLLNPQSGMFKPSEVKIFEVLESAGKTIQVEAQNSNTGLNYSVGSEGGRYFVNYLCSAPLNGTNLKMALVQLSSTQVDTIKFELNTSLMPTKIFYNGRSVSSGKTSTNDVVIIK